MRPSAGAGTGFVVRRILEEDWRELRDLRLTALADTPIAFEETHADALRLGDDAWQERARRGATGTHEAMFAATAPDGRWLGITGVFLEPDLDPTLFAVFVRPEARGGGVVEALVEAAGAWAVDASGATRLRLEVREDNLRACRVYERLGFVVTGQARPYPLDPSYQELEMVRALR